MRGRSFVRLLAQLPIIVATLPLVVEPYRAAPMWDELAPALDPWQWRLLEQRINPPIRFPGGVVPAWTESLEAGLVHGVREPSAPWFKVKP